MKCHFIIVCVNTTHFTVRRAAVPPDLVERGGRLQGDHVRPQIGEVRVCLRRRRRRPRRWKRQQGTLQPSLKHLSCLFRNYIALHAHVGDDHPVRVWPRGEGNHVPRDGGGAHQEAGGGGCKGLNRKLDEELCESFLY